MDEQLKRIIIADISEREKLGMILSKNCDYGGADGAMLSVNAMPKAIEDILTFFENNNRFRMNYLDEDENEQSLEVWATSQDAALDRLKVRCPKATYIFIDKK